MEDKMSNIIIHDYDSKYDKDIMEISLEWLVKHNVLEDEDYVMLNNPKKEVIDKGGHIILAEYDGEIVGMVGLEPMEEGVCEMLKFGVKECVQGKGIGNMLAKRIIEIAREDGYKKMTLCTNSFLKNAVHIYEKLGFKYVEFTESRFEISDTMMELEL